MAKSAHGKVSIPEQIVEQAFHPFGQGVISTNGVQYSTPATSVLNAFIDVQEVTITPPVDLTLIELELGITWRQRSAGTTNGAVGKIQGRNSGGTWVDLMATPQTNAAIGTAFEEFTYSGRFKPEANLDETPIDIKVVVKSSGTTDHAIGQVKNSSYVKIIGDAR